MLKKGQVFKNWIEVCKFFGWKTTGGTYKEARLKELDTICEYHKEGYKFIIDKVFNKPKQKEDNRKGNSGRKEVGYIFSLKNQLLRMLVQDYNNYINGTTNEYGKQMIDENTNIKTTNYMLRATGLTNNKFKYGENNIDKASTFINIPIEVANELFTGTKSMVKRNLENALQQLYNEKLIQWQNTFTIQLKKEDGTFLTKQVTKEENDIIFTCEQDAIFNCGCKNMKEVVCNIGMKKYYEVVYKLIKKKIPNFVRYWSAYKIEIRLEFIKKYIKENKIRTNSKKDFFIVNEGVIDRAKENAKSRVSNAKKRTDDKYSYRLEDCYLEQVDNFIYEFVNIKSDNNLEQLKYTKPNYKHYKSKKQQMMEQCQELFSFDKE